MGFKRRDGGKGNRLQNQANALLEYLKYQGATRLWDVRNAIGSSYGEFDQVVEMLGDRVELVGRCPKMIRLTNAQQVRRSA